MNIAIDAVSTNIGGGLDYILNLINNSNPKKHNFNKIILFTNKEIKHLIPKKKFIKIITVEKDSFFWILKKTTLINHFILKKKIDLLYVPSAINFVKKTNIVVMNQTLLPFRFDQIIRYFPNFFFFKLLLIRYLQLSSFRNSNGVIFLNNYGKRVISQLTKIKNSTIIPLGINEDKFKFLTKNINHRAPNQQIKIIYISEVTNYKNHYDIISQLKNSNINFIMYFVGKVYTPYYKKLKKLNFSFKKFIFTGNLDPSQVIRLLKDSDLFLFASSVENFPVSVLEGLVSNKPLLTTRDEPVKSIIGKRGLFFSLQKPGDLELKINKAITKFKKKKNTAVTNDLINYDKITQDTFKYFTSIFNKAK
jgi:hypothetical protein